MNLISVTSKKKDGVDLTGKHLVVASRIQHMTAVGADTLLFYKENGRIKQWLVDDTFATIETALAVSDTENAISFTPKTKDGVAFTTEVSVGVNDIQFVSEQAINSIAIATATAGAAGVGAVTLTGDFAAAITAAGTVTITGSTGNDGTYKVTSATFSTPTTTVVMTEALPDGADDGKVTYADSLIMVEKGASKTKYVSALTLTKVKTAGNAQGSMTFTSGTIEGDMVVQGTTDATTSTTGSLKTAGGLGVAKAAYFGTSVNAATYITSGDGTAALPAIGPVSDPDSGLYVIGANNLGIAVNAAKVLDINTSGIGVVGYVVKGQIAPTNSNTDPASKSVMATSMLNGILTATPAAAINYTLPTGTEMQTAAGTTIDINQSVDFSIVNIGAGGIITVVAAAGFTIVGVATVAAASTAMFRIRKTAANTFELYRVA